MGFADVIGLLCYTLIVGLLKMIGSSRWIQQWAHRKLLKTLPSCANWPIHLSWQFYPWAAHNICTLLLDGPMWVHRCNRSIYTMPRSWAHSRCSAALDEFNHRPTVNYWQLFLAVPICPSIYLGSYANQCPWPIWAIWHFYPWAQSWYMLTVTWWAHMGFTDVIGFFTLHLDHGPTQDVWQLWCYVLAGTRTWFKGSR